MAEKRQLIALAKQLKAGDKNAAEALYEAYYRDLHYYVLKRVHDPEMADAMTREMFIELFENIDTLSDANDFVEWSRQIADRRCEEYRNARKALLFGKVGSAIVSSIEEERKELHSEESEEDAVFSVPAVERKSGIRTGARLIESIGRKVLVGVVAALILTVIREGGLNWRHTGDVLESTEVESTEQIETSRMTDEESLSKETEQTEATEAWTEPESEIEETSSAEETEGESSTPEETEGEPTTPEETEPPTPEETIPEPTTQEVFIPETTTQAVVEIPEEIKPEETVRLILRGGYWEVVGFVATQGTEMVVPATHEGLPVIVIGENAMQFHGMLTSVQLPDGIETILPFAFQACYELRSINLPESIGLISSYAFSGCNKLEGIVLPSQLWQISTGTFEGCMSLTEINIPEKVQLIANDAFRACTGLTEIRIPASVTSIAASAFSDCDNLVRIEVAEDNPVYYSEGNCLLTKAGNKLILCGNDSVIPSDGRITSIGEFALVNCREWMELVIPDGVQEIGAHACDNLRIWKVTIPVSVTSIEAGAFALTNLSTIVYGGTIEQWNAIEKAQGWANGCTYKVHCTDGIINEWSVVVG